MMTIKQRECCGRWLPRTVCEKLGIPVTPNPSGYKDVVVLDNFVLDRSSTAIIDAIKLMGDACAFEIVDIDSTRQQINKTDDGREVISAKAVRVK